MSTDMLRTKIGQNNGTIECVSKNGNMLLNVGPNAKGEIPVESEQILAEV